MVITQDKVVSIGYVLKNERGEVLDASQEKPLTYLHGHANLIPGLERVLSGMKVGEKTQTLIPPEEGYGAFNPELVFALPATRFGSEIPPLNTLVELQTQNGDSIRARIADTSPEQVTLDANHPLAGKNLHFEVEVTSIREASAQELAHGHAH